MGVPALKVQVIAFALTSMLACLAGYVSVARFSSVDALRGQGTELEVVLAVVIGGASLNGGYGTIGRMERIRFAPRGDPETDEPALTLPIVVQSSRGDRHG